MNKKGCSRQWYKVVVGIETSVGIEIVAREFAGTEPKAKNLMDEYARTFPPRKGFITAIKPIKRKPADLIRVSKYTSEGTVNYYKVSC